MSRLARLAASASVVALTATGAQAHVMVSAGSRLSGLPQLERLAQRPQAKDMGAVREFTVFLRDDAAGAAPQVLAYFQRFGFKATYFPYTNTVQLFGNYAQAAQAGRFSYIAGRVSIAALRSDKAPNFPGAVGAAIQYTTFNPGPVAQADLSFTVNAPSTMPQHFGVYGLAPDDYATIYGYSNLYSSNINGKGQTIDIAACFGYNTSDLATFASDFVPGGPKPNVTAVTANAPVSSSIEPDLDVQRSYGTAPGAAIRMFFAPDCALNEFTTIFTDIANDQKKHPAASMNVSYGLPELIWADLYGSLLEPADEALAKITTSKQKVGIFISSGDDGDDAIEELFDFGVPAGQADVSFWSSDPHVISVGGTNLVLDSNFERAHEYAWSGSAKSNFGGSGGGVSNIWPIPSWQANYIKQGGPGADNMNPNFKNLPDVASVASLNSPPLMVSSAFGGIIQVGGTSASSPTMAGTWALLQQYFKQNNGHPLIRVPTQLYTNLASQFTDILGGSNGRYVATPGWDDVTGLGVPCLGAFPGSCPNPTGN